MNKKNFKLELKLSSQTRYNKENSIKIKNFYQTAPKQSCSHQETPVLGQHCQSPRLQKHFVSEV